MSFQQPTATTIRSFHFQGNRYDFPVTSALATHHQGSQLLIEASAGYLLTTPDNETPQAQLRLSYGLQPDGSGLVDATVTLIADGTSPTGGTVTLRDPLGEVLTLAVLINPSLVLSDSTLSFNRLQINEDKEVVAILKISQQGAHSPVVLTTDDPSRFALAASSNSRHFTPDLTVTPSGAGTYIFVRYTPAEAGQHQALLHLKTSYESQTVLLLGYAGSKPGWYRAAWWVGLWTEWVEQLNQPVTIRFPRIVFPAVLLAGGLMCTTYAYRCQLVPGLCQSQGPSAAIIAPTNPVRRTEQVFTAEAIEQRFINRQTKRVSIDNPVSADGMFGDPAAETEDPSRETIDRVLAKTPGALLLKSGARMRPSPRRQLIVQATLATLEPESDLEKLLNKKPHARRDAESSPPDRREIKGINPYNILTTNAHRAR